MLLIKKVCIYNWPGHMCQVCCTVLQPNLETWKKFSQLRMIVYILLTNNADPDQPSFLEQSDLDLHCLLKHFCLDNQDKFSIGTLFDNWP